MSDDVCMCPCHWDGMARLGFCPDDCCSLKCKKWASTKGDFDAARYQVVWDAEEQKRSEEAAKKQAEKDRIQRIRKRLGLSKSQYFYPKTGRASVKPWEETMDRREVDWCIEMIRREISDGEYEYVDSFRAARAWKSSQVRRFKKLRT